MAKRDHVHKPSVSRRRPFFIVSADGQRREPLSVRKTRAARQWRQLRTQEPWHGSSMQRG